MLKNAVIGFICDVMVVSEEFVHDFIGKMSEELLNLMELIYWFQTFRNWEQ